MPLDMNLLYKGYRGYVGSVGENSCPQSTRRDPSSAWSGWSSWNVYDRSGNWGTCQNQYNMAVYPNEDGVQERGTKICVIWLPRLYRKLDMWIKGIEGTHYHIDSLLR